MTLEEDIQSILATGCINQLYKNNFTPLICVSRDGLYELAKQLIDAGADVDSKTVFLEAAIDHAAANGHLDIVKLLVEHQAHLSKSILRAARENHLEVVQYLYPLSSITHRRLAYGIATDKRYWKIVSFIDQEQLNGMADSKPADIVSL